MKDHLLQLVQAADPVQGRNVLREYLQARILDVLQRAGAMVPLVRWRGIRWWLMCVRFWNGKKMRRY